MKRLALIAAAALGLVLSNGVANAGFGTLSYGGYQPWWNPCAIGHRKCKTCEERRLEHFWHDYYDSLRKYYKALEHVDWVAYYKNHGYQIGGGCCGPTGGCCGPMGCGPMGYGGYGQGGDCCRINYAPVFVTPSMQWAIPAGCGAPCGPGGLPPGN
jgi:hypothetical protein